MDILFRAWNLQDDPPPAWTLDGEPGSRSALRRFYGENAAGDQMIVECSRTKLSFAHSAIGWTNTIVLEAPKYSELSAHFQERLAGKRKGELGWEKQTTLDNVKFDLDELTWMCAVLLTASAWTSEPTAGATTP